MYMSFLFFQGSQDMLVGFIYSYGIRTYKYVNQSINQSIFWDGCMYMYNDTFNTPQELV